MRLRLAVTLCLLSFAPPAFGQILYCDPAAGCITLTVNTVDIGAGTIAGSTPTSVITVQITPDTMVKPPSPNCAPSDPFYAWQQLVYAGANNFDPNRHAFLGQLAGWSKKPTHPPNPSFIVTLDAALSATSIQPISCTGSVACVTNTDCFTGDICEAGVCSVPCNAQNCPGLCVSATSCGPSVTCVTNTDCPSGDVCQAGVCAVPCNSTNCSTYCVSATSCAP